MLGDQCQRLATSQDIGKVRHGKEKGNDIARIIIDLTGIIARSVVFFAFASWLEGSCVYVAPEEPFLLVQTAWDSISGYWSIDVC